jgi:hypothetical protein
MNGNPFAPALLLASAPAMHRPLATALALVVLAAPLAACGTKTITTTNAQGQVSTREVPNVHFAKTKFVLHMGLAFGAFHRYIYKPAQAGTFKSGANGRIRAFAKAGAAGLFIVHELKEAHKDALSDDKLRPLADKVDNLDATLGGLGAQLKRGAFNPSGVAAGASAVSALSSASGGLGASIKELAPPGLG